MTVQPIVEGHGEVAAVPVLLRRLCETADQPALTARFDMRRAYARCRSFRRLVAAFGSLLRATGVDVGQWPPACWTGSDR